MKITMMSSKSALSIESKPVFSGYQVWNPGILTGPGIKEPTREAKKKTTKNNKIDIDKNMIQLTYEV